MVRIRDLITGSYSGKGVSGMHVHCQNSQKVQTGPTFYTDIRLKTYSGNNWSVGPLEVLVGYWGLSATVGIECIDWKGGTLLCWPNIGQVIKRMMTQSSVYNGPKLAKQSNISKSIFKMDSMNASLIRYGVSRNSGLALGELALFIFSISI